MSDSGLHQKYEVYEDGDPVEGCFVLEPESDEAAREALEAYADATDDDELADDLYDWIESIRSGGSTAATDGGKPTDAEGRPRADPEDVDRERVLALGECPNCGPRSLATVRVEDAEYIAECAKDSCDHELRAPVVVDEDGEHVVAFDEGRDEVAV